jgi:hypothetical protein
MQAVQEAMQVVEAGRQGRLAELTLARAADSLEDAAHHEVLVEEARWLLLRAVRGSERAGADLRALKPALIGRASQGDAYACEILAAMCASRPGGARDAQQAQDWIVRAVGLLEDHVRRPVAGHHGFMLLPTDEAESAYRPIYTAEGVLITDEIGIAHTEGGQICFDRWGRPMLDERPENRGGPARATPKAVAARIARESTLEDFAWACRRTTRQFRLALIDARVIAHGRMGFQRWHTRARTRFAAAA